MADERKPIEYVGYAIDRGIPFDGIWKGIDFFDGVGVLDYRTLAGLRSEWFEFNASGEIIGIRPNAVPMQTFVDYWEGMGCKVTQISETEAKEIRAALVSKHPIDPKYLKSVVDTRAVAGGGPPKGATSEPSGDSPKDDSPTLKKKGKK